jgi:dTDP-4-dehydrorhamnose reductase
MSEGSNIRLLVTGAEGMLGRRVVEAAVARGVVCHGTDVSEEDLTLRDDVRRLFERVSPTHVVHCAAWTDVDGAEAQPEKARLVNVEATRLVAEAARETGARMLFVSTDFVFDGKASEPYKPDDNARPLSVYAESKWQGEEVVRGTIEDYLIVRTSWLFGPNGKNFVDTMRGLFEQGVEVSVVCDEVGSPTYSVELASRLVEMVLNDGVVGTYHLTGAGSCSWYELACYIAEEVGYDPEKIGKVTAQEWGATARRPKYSVLDCTSTYATGIAPMPNWRDSVRKYIGDY